MRRAEHGATRKQWAYAKNSLNPSVSRGEAAKLAGYGPSLVSHPARIDQATGTQNAMAHLAAEAGNLALSAMHTLKSRGFDEFSNAELVRALTAIAGAYEKFQPKMKEPADGGAGSALRALLLSRNGNDVQVSEVIDAEVIEEAEQNPFDI